METFVEQHFDWIVVKPIRIVLILLAAFVLARLARRAIARLMNRLATRASGQPELVYGARSSAPSPEKGPEPSAQEGFEAFEAPRALRSTVARALTPAERNARVAQRATTLGHALGSAASVVIYIVAIMLCLGELGLDLGPLLAAAGVVGIALGLGTQTLVRDVLNGLFILVEDQYGVGDIVDLGEATGVIEEVTLRATRVRALDGTLWHVPNGEIRRAGNMSQTWSRALIDIPLAYDTDLEAVSAIVRQVAERAQMGDLRDQILEPPELWGVDAFGPHALTLRLVVKTAPGSQWAVERALRAELKRAFDEAGIEMALPWKRLWPTGSTSDPYGASPPKA